MASAHGATLGGSDLGSDGAALDEFAHLVTGCNMYKFGRNGKPGLRLVRVSRDLSLLQWTSKRKKPRDSCVRLQNVERIQSGRHTAKFARFPSAYGEEAHSFSVIYATPSGQDKTLDLTCLSRSDYAAWFEGLQVLVARLQGTDARRRVGVEHDALLRAGSAFDDAVQGCGSGDSHTGGTRMWRGVAMGSLRSANGDGTDGTGSGTGLRHITASWKQVREALQSLGLHHVTRDHVRSVLDDDASSLNRDAFVELVRRVTDRPDIQRVFGQLQFSPEQAWITPAAFLQFMRVQQGQAGATADDVRALLGVLRRRDSAGADGGDGAGGVASGAAGGVAAAAVASTSALFYRDFAEYVWSDANDAVAPVTHSVYQDMSRPLAHYFIASSHNTYLEGDQLTSRSSVNMYINVLMQGCRCVELDCHDGPDMEPIIYHGRTLTTRIKLRAVVQAVREFGFRSSVYPVILSLEMHCSLPQQRRVADILRSELGPLLLGPLSDDESFAALPSPWALRGRVIVKGKTLTKVVNPQPVPISFVRQELQQHAARSKGAGGTGAGASAGASAGAGHDSGAASAARRHSRHGSEAHRANTGMVGRRRSAAELAVLGGVGGGFGVVGAHRASTAPTGLRLRRARTNSCPDLAAVLAASATSPRARANGAQAQTAALRHARPSKLRKPVAPELAAVISLRAIKFPGFDESDANSACVMSSFREAKFRALVKRDAAGVVRYNMRHMSRVYPNPIRVDSSNFDPFVGWALGVQMTALNYQTHGPPLLLNQARFRQNARCGYVLKPSWMCEPADDGALRARVARNQTPHRGAQSPRATSVDLESSRKHRRGGTGSVDSTDTDEHKAASVVVATGPRHRRGYSDGVVADMVSPTSQAARVMAAAAPVAASAPPLPPAVPSPRQLASQGLLLPDGASSAAVTFVVDVLSAKELPVPRAKGVQGATPYCVVQIRGVPADAYRARTPSVRSNGLNPLWQQQHRVHVTEPSIAILLIAVCHQVGMRPRDEPLAYFAAPLTSLRRGFRRCQLRTRSGKLIPQSCLLCRFDTAVVPGTEADGALPLSGSVIAAAGTATATATGDAYATDGGSSAPCAQVASDRATNGAAADRLDFGVGSGVIATVDAHTGIRLPSQQHAHP